ncbi:hypothetical protein ACVRY7_04290 [Streptococcus ictaluri]|uniref:Uncharacterized protein n=1 Tax=Streptococcus ictaluri 707-05 TaxID=764299 RepID=G5K331_9STRE|nr:hypothetical protein [Streptococcus ictaluri]EHI69463.1 hypothetical protein STRIC_1199 [Streptococcus ictaluri 707-05]
MTWTYDTISQNLSEMAKSNYQDLVKAFLAMEFSLDNQPILNRVYQDFMKVDDMPLLSDDLRQLATHYQEEVKAELTDMFEKLYGTGEGSSFVMDVMASNSILETMGSYDILDSEDYSSLTLETLQEIVQHDLPISSQDYFGDVSLLALEKDLLDQKSQFLQHYVTSLLETMPQLKDQRDLVLE